MVGVLIIGSDVSPGTCVLPKSGVAGAAPRTEHTDKEVSMVDPYPALHASIMGSFGRPVPRPVCTPNCSPDHTPGSSGCLCAAKASRLPVSVH